MTTPIVEAAIEQRRKFFESETRPSLSGGNLFTAFCSKARGRKPEWARRSANSFRDPTGAIGELKAQFTNDNMKTLLRSQIERDVACLDQRVQASLGSSRTSCKSRS